MNHTNRLLLCSDLDRTLIPNGFQSEPADARHQFARFCEGTEIDLVYVTGRHLALVEKAIANYLLPIPAFCVTDVGTRIYRRVGSQWREVEEWQRRIARDWHGLTSPELKELLRGFDHASLQEPSKQSDYKLSFYVSLMADHQYVVQGMSRRLEREGIEASLIWSIDEPKGIGLLDVLPANATKLHAVEFLYQQLDYTLEETVFAGDSGNDLPVMASALPAVLVANASDDIKREARHLAAAAGHLDRLYIADSNYSAGVLEGVRHFMPHLDNPLEG